jgi:hypothetical protein
MVFYALWSVTTTCVSALLLFGAASPRFHTEARRVRRLISMLLICWGLPIIAMLVDQLVRWPLGTPPFWLQPSNYGKGWSEIELQVMNAQRVIWPFVELTLGFLAVAAGCVELMGGRGTRMRFQVIAVAWLVPMAFPLATLMVHAGHGHSSWANVCSSLLRDCFAGLLSLFAWCSVRSDDLESPVP